MNRRRLLVPIVAAAAALALVAAGCGGSKHNGTTGGGAGSSGAGATTVTRSASQTLKIYGFGTGDEVAQARAKLAMKAVAPAKVSNPNGGFNDQVFLTEVASGQVPDLVYLDRQKVGTYAAKGALMPLTSCIKSQGIDTSQFRKPALDEVTYKGQIFGLPEFYDNRVLYINDNVVKNPASVSTSDKQALMRLATTLARKSGGKVTRIGFDPKLPEFFPLWAKAFGVDLLSPNGMTAKLDSPQAIQALTFATGLINAQGGWNSFSSFRNTFDFFGAGNEFAKNQLGAFPMEDWYVNVLAQNSPHVKLTIKPFTTLSGKPLDWETGSAWAIPAKAMNPQLACLWAKTMTSVSAWMAAAKARIAVDHKANSPFTGLYTANQVADQKLMKAYFKPSGNQWSKAVQTIEKVQSSAFGLPASPAGNEFQTAWTNAVNRVLTGQQTPAAALKQAQQEAQSAIAAAST
jgi:multiple sugar transport system substrate-binding protein